MYIVQFLLSLLWMLILRYFLLTTNQEKLIKIWNFILQPNVWKLYVASLNKRNSKRILMWQSLANLMSDSANWILFNLYRKKWIKWCKNNLLISLLVSHFQRSVWECSVHICSCHWLSAVCWMNEIIMTHHIFSSLVKLMWALHGF